MQLKKTFPKKICHLKIDEINLRNQSQYKYYWDRTNSATDQSIV